MQGEREGRVYDFLPAARLVVFAHQSRGHIYRHDVGTCRIDVLYHRCVGIFEGAGKPRAEQSVDNQHVAVKSGRHKLMHHLVQPHAGFHKSVPIHRTVGREPVFGVEKYTFDPITLFCKHTRHGQGIAAVVSRAGKDHDRPAAVPPFRNFPGNGSCGPFHQVDRGNRFVLDGVSVDFLYLVGRKYFHGGTVFFEAVAYSPSTWAKEAGGLSEREEYPENKDIRFFENIVFPRQKNHRCVACMAAIFGKKGGFMLNVCHKVCTFVGLL